MKKLGLLLAILCSLQANGQPFSISFSGTGLTTVKVQNLTTGVIVDVPAGDVLYLSTTTDIQEDINLESSGLKIYPNPVTDKSTLTILPPISGDAIITICDLAGKVLTQFKGYMENYTQEFSLSGIRNGLHIINVQGNGYHYSLKILSIGKSHGTAIINKSNDNIQSFSIKKAVNDSKGPQATVDMVYNSGERLLYTAVSGNNRTVFSDIPIEDKTVNFTFTECKDGDNYYYPVVSIGAQTWMAENLKSTKYRNGDLILTTSPYNKDISGEGAPKYQWSYLGNENNVIPFARLYTWFAATDSRSVCPTGWHLPSDAEFTTLVNYLIANGYNYDATTTGNKIAKTLASTTLWTSYTGAGTVGNTDYPAKRNASSFTAYPSGFRSPNGTSNFINKSVTWWSATQNDATNAWLRDLTYNSIYVGRNFTDKKYGFSVRCIKD